MGTIARIFIPVAGLLIASGAFAQQAGTISSWTLGLHAARSLNDNGLIAASMWRDGDRPLSVSPAEYHPEGEYIEISFVLDRRAAVTVDLVSVSGGETYRPIETAEYAAGERNERVDVGALPDGTYLLRLSTPYGSSQQRIAIER